MGRVIINRILIGIPVVCGAVVLIWLALHLLPGDPVAALLAGAPSTPQMEANLRHQYGLDKPLYIQFLIFLSNTAHLDFGRSYATNQPVSQMIASQAPATLELAGAAILLTAIFGVLFGVLAALYRDTIIDGLIRVLSLLGTAMPIFWTGILLLQVFSFHFHLFPATGTWGLAALVLPAVSLALFASGIVIRLVRNSMIEVLSENFVTALYAKGLRRSRVIFGHVLRNALIPAVTIVGLQIGGLLSGAVITETIFAREGIGRILVAGIEGKDYPVVQGTMLFIAVIYVAVNIVVDISYAYIDPRVRSAITRGQE